MPQPPSLTLPRADNPARWLLGALALCLALGLGEASMAVLGSYIRPGSSLAPEVAAGLLIGNTWLRAITAASMLLLALWAQRWIAAPGWWRYGLALTVAVLAGTVLAWAVYETLLCGTARTLGYAVRYPQCNGVAPVHNWTPLNVARQFQVALLVVGLVSFLALGRHAARVLHRTRLEALALERERAAAHAGLLQAQIEPHFLFNTLANLRRLLRTDATAGLSMLADLRRYLQEALPRLRGPGASLEEEMALVRAYLELHAVRMGQRLQYDIHLPERLRTAAVPPMLVLTLVENALKHGLQPLPEGGRIEVAAQQAEEGLCLTVRDTGRGMGQAIGHGMGLANLRGRLQALYGPRANLALRLNEPRGLCAVVTLPMAPA